MAEATSFDADQIAAGAWLFAQPWVFTKGVVALDGLPRADRPEVAFAGRSNVGKSSLINALTRRTGLARTSNTPGRTQEINYFSCQSTELYLVDLPGYGFAEAPKAKVDAWTGLVRGYLRGRPTLTRVMLLIDARHGLKDVDLEHMQLMNEAAVSYQIVLTKADKLSHSALASVLARTEVALSAHPAAYPHVLATSSAKEDGIPELRAAVAMLAGIKHG